MLEFSKSQVNGSGTKASFKTISTCQYTEFTLFKQNGYDKANRCPMFDGGASLSVHLDKSDIGYILRSLNNVENRIKYTTPVHDFVEDVNFHCTYIEHNFLKNGKTEYVDKFLMELTSNSEDTKISIHFSLGDVEVLKEFFKWSLHRFFTALDSREKVKFKEKAKTKNSLIVEPLEDDKLDL